MAILSVTPGQVGLVGVLPSIAYIYTSDTEAAVLTTGYLNKEVANGMQFSLPAMACVTTQATPTSAPQVGWYQIAHVGSNWSLVPNGSPGDVVLPTVANQIIHATNATGTLSSDAANIVNLGNITAGSSAVAGSLTSFAGTGSTEFLRLAAINNTGGNFSTTISNTASVGQSQTISIPDSGAAAANFILSASAGTQNITAGALQVNAGVISSGLSTGGTAGGLILYPATTTTGSLRLTPVSNVGNFAATISNIVGLGQATVYTLPDPGAATANILVSAAAGGQTIAGGLTISTGNLTVSAGNVVAGATGAAGSVTSFSGTGSAEFLRLAAIDNAGGNFSTTISNASSVGQSQVISIPDAGAATGNFLLDAGAANILAQQEFVSINEVLSFGTGTWTTTRIAQGNYVKRHTPGDETSIIGIDITPMIRVAASKGFRLDSFDIIYAIAANALDAHSAVLDRIAYANNVAVSITSIPITVTLATATQANPYVTNAVVDTPAFDITADSKYVLEVTVDNAAASEYDFYGVMLRFSQTIG